MQADETSSGPFVQPGGKRTFGDTHLLNFVCETDTGTASACNIVSVMTRVTRHVDDMMGAPSSPVPWYVVGPIGPIPLRIDVL